MKRTAAVQPDINVTPLVDVVLVLLIIFMVVAPRMDQDVPVELPGIFNPDPDAESQLEPLKISVGSDGTVHLDDRAYGIDEAVAILGGKHSEEPMRRLIIRADRRLKYGQVRDLLAKTRKVGFPGTSLLVGEKSRPGEADAPASATAASAEPSPPAARGAASRG